MPGTPDPEILNIEQAAQLLGVSVKTFNKVLHTLDLPARKIGREWKFSRSALIAWVGLGSSRDYYRENGSDEELDLMEPQPPPAVDGAKPAAADQRPARAGEPQRRTSGWRIEDKLD
jgi:excisionase family DNA binding protein